MRSLARRAAGAAAAALPALAAAEEQTAYGADTGQSPWNWVVGIAALLVVLAIAWDLFGPAGRARTRDAMARADRPGPRGRAEPPPR